MEGPLGVRASRTLVPRAVTPRRVTRRPRPSPTEWMPRVSVSRPTAAARPVPRRHSLVSSLAGTTAWARSTRRVVMCWTRVPLKMGTLALMEATVR